MIVSPRRKKANNPCVLHHIHFPLALVLTGKASFSYQDNMYSWSHPDLRYFCHTATSGIDSEVGRIRQCEWMYWGLPYVDHEPLRGNTGYHSALRIHPVWVIVERPVHRPGLQHNHGVVIQTIELWKRGLVSISHSGRTVQQSAVSWGSVKWTTIWETYEEWSGIDL